MICSSTQRPPALPRRKGGAWSPPAPPHPMICPQTQSPRRLRRRKGEAVSHHHTSHAELRRELRSLGATSESDTKAAHRVFSRLFDSGSAVDDGRKVLF